MKNLLKICLIFGIFIFVCFPALSQENYAIKGVYTEEGASISPDDILLTNANCIFTINKKSTLPTLSDCTWIFSCLDKDSVYIEERRITGGENFNLILDTLNINTELLRIIKFEQDNSNYFQGKISVRGKLESDEYITLHFPVYLNVLPSDVNLNILDIQWNEEADISSINLSMNADRANIYRVYNRLYQGDWPFITNIYPVPIEEAENWHLVDFYYDKVEIFVISMNKFGYVTSPTYDYKTLLLITDIDNIENDRLSFSFYPNPMQDILNIEGEYENIQTLTFFDSSGKIIKQIKNLRDSTIGVSDLGKGIYFLNVQRKNCTKDQIHKIIKN